MTLEADIAETSAAIVPLMAKLQRLNAEKREKDSRDFIAVNKIKRSDVEFSSGDGKPRFGTVFDFVDWMRVNATPFKRWTEWNGRIYHTVDLLSNRMPETPATADHLAQ